MRCWDCGAIVVTPELVGTEESGFTASLSFGCGRCGAYYTMTVEKHPNRVVIPPPTLTEEEIAAKDAKKGWE